MEIESRDLDYFNAHNMWDDEYNGFLLSDEQMRKLETKEEIKKAWESQKNQLCDLVSKERELLYYKEKFLRNIVILEAAYGKLCPLPKSFTFKGMDYED